MEAEKEGEETSRGLHFPMALHPLSNGRQSTSLSLVSQPPRSAPPRRFRRNLRREQVLAASRPLSRGPPKHLGNAGPATDDLRSSIKNPSKLAARRKECQANCWLGRRSRFLHSPQKRPQGWGLFYLPYSDKKVLT